MQLVWCLVALSWHTGVHSVTARQLWQGSYQKIEQAERPEVHQQFKPEAHSFAPKLQYTKQKASHLIPNAQPFLSTLLMSRQVMRTASLQMDRHHYSDQPEDVVYQPAEYIAEPNVRQTAQQITRSSRRMLAANVGNAGDTGDRDYDQDSIGHSDSDTASQQQTDAAGNSILQLSNHRQHTRAHNHIHEQHQSELKTNSQIQSLDLNTLDSQQEVGTTLQPDSQDKLEQILYSDEDDAQQLKHQGELGNHVSLEYETDSIQAQEAQQPIDSHVSQESLHGDAGREGMAKEIVQTTSLSSAKPVVTGLSLMLLRVFAPVVGGFLIALTGYLPLLYWSWTNDSATWSSFWIKVWDWRSYALDLRLT